MKIAAWLLLLMCLCCTPAPSPWLPDGSKTPGAVDSALTKDRLCDKSFRTGTVRDVPASVKAAVYRAYGMDPKKHLTCEIDHLVSLELGGSNAIANLWPEPYSLNVGGMEMGAHEKDRAEDATHTAVCRGDITLADAQAQIRTDWTILYRRFVAKTFPQWKDGKR